MSFLTFPLSSFVDTPFARSSGNRGKRSPSLTVRSNLTERFIDLPDDSDEEGAGPSSSAEERKGQSEGDVTTASAALSGTEEGDEVLELAEGAVEEMTKDLGDRAREAQQFMKGAEGGAGEKEENPHLRKYADEEPSDENWPKHHKHIFVLSNAGKPIYSRYGDESKLSGVIGLLSAMISFAETEDDEIHEIIAGIHKIVFFQKGPLYFASVSRTKEPTSDLVLQLEYVHSQIICLLTAGVNRIFVSRADFDLRNLLSGTEKMFDNLLSVMDHDPSIFTDSIHCLPLEQGVRNTVGKILQECRSSSVLYGMIIARRQIVNMIRPRKHPLLPADLHLILNVVNSSTSFRTNESWSPICLPQFNEKGFMHSYVTYIAEDICLLLISTKGDSFYELSECAKKILLGLEVNNCLVEIEAALQSSRYTVEEVGSPELLHFMYISRITRQLTMPDMTAPYSNRHARKRLFRLYQYVHNRSRSHEIFYYSSKNEIVLGWETHHVCVRSLFL